MISWNIATSNVEHSRTSGTAVIAVGVFAAVCDGVVNVIAATADVAVAAFVVVFGVVGVLLQLLLLFFLLLLLLLFFLLALL